MIKNAPPAYSLRQAIKRQAKISLIAEIKQASPSAGVLKKDFSAVRLAQLFEKHKVAALSVLTEEEFFLGKLSYIEEIRKVSQLPLLRKDFILDEVQILESRAVGADAVLLIAALLNEEKLKELYRLSKELGMEALVEVHTQKELHCALRIGAEIIGINNRNLHTLKVEITTTQKLIPFLPSDIVKVSESGISSLKEVLWLKGLGVEAVLVGEALMKAENIEEKLKELNIDYA